MSDLQSSDLTAQEVAKRRDRALLRALTTPPKPHKAILKKRVAKADQSPEASAGR